ncbi:DUF1989 domain-containing protein [Rhodobacteraceae bacterium CCMM004]|nr:DUF1989 domain-containing protein [Rhodobacteraceae bacterium CCMM004]
MPPIPPPDQTAPPDAARRRAAAPVICYPPDTLPPVDRAWTAAIRRALRPVRTTRVPPRDGRAVRVARGQIVRIVCPEGPQVGDLNLWSAADPSERFYSGKTRALHGAHVSAGDRLWSTFPHLRPLATITHDTLAWYGIDADGGAVHDVIGTRCDPYTARLLSGDSYHRCCHSNLTRALADALDCSRAEAEPLVHDVLNVFMCTGFSADTHQYFMKASPVRAGDYLELYAEVDLLVGLSACPGGDCGAEHSSDAAPCHPLDIAVYDTDPALHRPAPAPSAYDRSHGA